MTWGYDAMFLADVCDVYLDAHEAGRDNSLGERPRGVSVVRTPFFRQDARARGACRVYGIPVDLLGSCCCDFAVVI